LTSETIALAAVEVVEVVEEVAAMAVAVDLTTMSVAAVEAVEVVADADVTMEVVADADVVADVAKDVDAATVETVAAPSSTSRTTTPSQRSKCLTGVGAAAAAAAAFVFCTMFKGSCKLATTGGQITRQGALFAIVSPLKLGVSSTKHTLSRLLHIVLLGYSR
jgi:hypothetical protein